MSETNSCPNCAQEVFLLVNHRHPENALIGIPITGEDVERALQIGKAHRDLPNDVNESDVANAVWEEVMVSPRFQHRELRTIIRGQPIIMRISTRGEQKPLIVEPTRTTFVPSAAQRIADIHANLDETVHQRVVDTARHDGFLLPELPGIKTFYVSSNWQLGAISDGVIMLIGPMDGVMMEWTLGLRPNQYGHYESFALVPRPSVCGRIVRKIRSWWSSSTR